MKNFYFLLIPFLICFELKAQLPEKKVINNFQKHINTLSADSMEGRMTGTTGEEKAIKYITSVYKEIGLKPKGSQNFIQPFTFSKGDISETKNTLTVNDINFKLNKDFFVLPFSGSAKIESFLQFAGYGIVAADHDDYKDRENFKGKIAIIDASLPDGYHPHSKYIDYADLFKRAETAAKKGASAVIFVSTDPHNPLLIKEYQKSSLTIPALFVIGSIDDLKGKATISTNLQKDETIGKNVIGYIENGKANTIIIGAHYDHLGYGEHGSLYKGEKAIHNGADDNASGVAMMLELARTLKNKKNPNHNYLFIAFSGEELGLFGSNYFTKNSTINFSNVNYMINLDMVGRLDSMGRIAINGVGTSSQWLKLIDTSKTEPLKIKVSESGIGPSDHTSFYLKDIPVLHFFTGTHPDYHKPTDDAHLINYKGMYKIYNYILYIASETDGMPKLDFQKTKEEDNKNVPRFTVTLGVVPDYMFSGEGMRIDGVSEGKPASKAGLEAGDIVVAIGDHKVIDMMSYMKALSQFKKGDKTNVKIMRNNELRDFNIEF